MKKTKVKNFVIIMISLFALLCAGNAVKATNEPLTLEKETIDVKLNGTYSVLSEGGDITQKRAWKSSDTSIVDVDESGKITGKKIGTATITVTRGTEKASCKVNVIYNSLQILNNQGQTSSINLFLDAHNTENLSTKILDYNSKEIKEANITWTSSDPSVVKIDNSGKISAVKVGNATITATAAGVTDALEVKVLEERAFTDFSKAKYENTLNDTMENLKITGVKPYDDYKTSYYYIITKDNKKPSITLSKNGNVDIEAMKDSLGYLNVNANENYLFSSNISKYTELNQDLYLWVVQSNRLNEAYSDENGNYIHCSVKMVVNGEKLKRAQLPQLNLIMQTFSIGNWSYSSGSDKYTRMNFNFPTSTENRKFTLKIGKVTDNNILNKIKNGDYSGITELANYAKKSDSIYSKDLTTTEPGYYRNEDTLFDGRKLLQNRAYYYIYVKFDDENGKYYPIEGVTLAQAYISSLNSNDWDMWGYTSSDFDWNNLTSTYTPSKTDDGKKDKTPDPTVTPEEKLPQTGLSLVIPVMIIAIGGIIFISYRKFKNIRLK